MAVTVQALRVVVVAGTLWGAASGRSAEAAPVSQPASQPASQPSPPAPTSQPSSAAAETSATGPSSAPARSDPDASAADVDVDATRRPGPATETSSTPAAEPGALDWVFPPADNVLDVARFTARPVRTDSATLLPRGMALAESGVEGFVARDPRDGTFARLATDVPALRLRLGVFDFLEARIAATYRIQDLDVGPGEIVKGFVSVQDLSAGAALRILQPDRFIPALSLHVDTLFPTESLRLTDVGVRSRVAASMRFFDRVETRINSGFIWDGPAQRFRLPSSAAVAVDLGFGATLYGESLIELDGAFQRPTTVWLNGGAAYSVTSWARLDALAGIAVLGVPGSFFVGLGISLLWPGLGVSGLPLP